MFRVSGILSPRSGDPSTARVRVRVRVRVMVLSTAIITKQALRSFHP